MESIKAINNPDGGFTQGGETRQPSDEEILRQNEIDNLQWHY